MKDNTPSLLFINGFSFPFNSADLSLKVRPLKVFHIKIRVDAKRGFSSHTYDLVGKNGVKKSGVLVVFIWSTAALINRLHFQFSPLVLSSVRVFLHLLCAVVCLLDAVREPL